MQVLFIVLSILSVTVSSEVNANFGPEEDLISNLPGLSEQPSFRQYSGYLNGSTDNFQLHYWYVDAETDPDHKPLILWLNGGPGCSSLEGLLEENGPFIVQADRSLKYNPHSWNKFANVLYLEAPAGVGFSYTRDKNVTTDDDLTSLNSYHALVNFFKKFPQLEHRDFYIMGESYAGVYVPTLAVRILIERPPAINLKGIAVGNGLVNYRFNDNSLLYFINFHGLVDESLWEDALKSCCGSQCAAKCMFTDDRSVPCEKAIAAIMNSIDGLNIYNLYSQCAGGVEQTDRLGAFRSPHSFSPARQNLFRDNIFMKLRSLSPLPDNPKKTIPCVDDSKITNYLRQSDVRKALHVDSHSLHLWAVCSEEVFSGYGRVYTDLSKRYKDILDCKIPVMLFDGDVDMACNYLGKLWFVDDLELEVSEPMRHWLFTDADKTLQIGGVCKTLQMNETPLHFVTVRGSGHMVPQDKPIAAYHMISRFIQGKKL